MTMMEEETKDAANVHEEEEEDGDDGEEEEGSEHDDDEDDITKQMVFMTTKDKDGENHHHKNWWINHNTNGNTDNGNSTGTTSGTNNDTNKVATIYEVFSFAEGSMTKYVGLTFGILAALVSGTVGPFMIFYFATAFEDLVADPTSDEFMENIKDLTYAFLVLG